MTGLEVLDEVLCVVLQPFGQLLADGLRFLGNVLMRLVNVVQAFLHAGKVSVHVYRLVMRAVARLAALQGPSVDLMLTLEGDEVLQVSDHAEV